MSKLTFFVACLLAGIARAQAGDALMCDDKRILVKLQSGYSSPDGETSVRIEAPRELAYGLPPPAARTAFEKARYCEARVVLGSGETDMAYYRLNVMKGGKTQDWVEPCFLKINAKGPMSDACADHRPAQ